MDALDECLDKVSQRDRAPLVKRRLGLNDGRVDTLTHGSVKRGYRFTVRPLVHCIGDII